jgi:hypothetical protein
LTERTFPAGVAIGFPPSRCVDGCHSPVGGRGRPGCGSPTWRQKWLQAPAGGRSLCPSSVFAMFTTWRLGQGGSLSATEENRLLWDIVHAVFSVVCCKSSAHGDADKSGGLMRPNQAVASTLLSRLCEPRSAALSVAAGDRGRTEREPRTRGMGPQVIMSGRKLRREPKRTGALSLDGLSYGALTPHSARKTTRHAAGSTSSDPSRACVPPLDVNDAARLLASVCRGAQSREMQAAALATDRQRSGTRSAAVSAGGPKSFAPVYRCKSCARRSASPR